MGRSFSDLGIAIILVGLFIVSFVILASYGSVKYGVTFDNTSYSAYDNINETYELTKQIQAKSNFNTSNSIFDIVGSIFSQGYGAIKLAANSFDTVNDMKDEAISESNLGPLSTVFAVSIGAIILIIIFIAILLRYVIKERT